jgi:hypothetical protein
MVNLERSTIFVTIPWQHVKEILLCGWKEIMEVFRAIVSAMDHLEWEDSLLILIAVDAAVVLKGLLV